MEDATPPAEDTTPLPVTAGRSMLGSEVRFFRAQKGLTQQQLAHTLGCSQGKINKIETGGVQIKAADLETIIQVCDIPDDDAAEMRESLKADQSGRLVNGQRGVRGTTSSPTLVPEHFRKFAALEPSAKTIRALHGERIPGLLQSEHYMLTQFRAAELADGALAELMIKRTERQRILTQKDPPLLQVILGEGAFRRIPGGPSPKVLRDQIDHLIEVTEEFTQVRLQIIPYDANLAYMPNDFTIMTFANGTTEFVYLEHEGGAQHVEDPKLVSQFVHKWEDVRDEAYGRKNTRKFLTDLAKDCRWD